MAEPSSPPPLVIPKVIVGLGNPGSKYEQTRHNIGFMVVEELARMWHISLAENRKFQAIVGEGLGPQSRKVHLVKPLTYMNASGQAIRAVIDWYKLQPESVLIVYDDMDLPLGKVRLRLSGSAGGHNGMKSAIAHLGTQNFPRLRIGIGSPKHPKTEDGKETISHVLGRFAPSELELVSQVIQLTVDAMELSLKQGIEKAMSLYNSRTLELAE